MTIETSALGLIATVIATSTYPKGFIISEWSGENDPLDIPEITIYEKQMGINGDLEYWKKANPIELTISVIANSLSDTYLTFLFNANRSAKGKRTISDKITIVFAYPDGTIKTCKNGFIETGSPIQGISSNGKIKARNFKFTFEDVI